MNCNESLRIMYKMLKYTVSGLIILTFLSLCTTKTQKAESSHMPYLLVLGNAQDAGYPQAGCEKDCCKRVYDNPENQRYITAIALIDPHTNENWVFDVTPNFPEQLKLLSSHLNKMGNVPNGLFVTHAHMGHYTGLMHLGREAMNTKNIPVFAMPKMKKFLSSNGPWSQLVQLNNIHLKELIADSTVVLNEQLKVKPLLVPHRDEYSETVGFLIQSKSKKALFIPDINKWNQWEANILDYIKEVDFAFLDGTFYKDGEIVGRPMSEIPHPFVEESMSLFKNLSDADKKKVHFIHFNHTNPLLIEGSDAQKNAYQNGFKIAKQGMIISL